MLKKLQALIDYFLPRHRLHRGALLRARAFIFLLEISVLFVVLGFIAGILTNTLTGRGLIMPFIYIFLQVCFLFACRKVKETEVVAFIYHTITIAMVVNECLFTSKSLLAQSLALFPATLLVSFVTIESMRLRLAFFLICLTSSAYCVYHIQGLGFYLPYGMDADILSTKMFSATLAKSLLTLVFMVWYRKAVEWEEQQFREQLNASIEEVKLNEINAMMNSIFPKLDSLLDRIEGTDEELPLHLTRLNEHAQTIGCIYRAFRAEHVGPTPSAFVEQQVRVLTQARMQAQKKVLETETSEFHMEGPVPSLILLMFALLEKILENSSLEEMEPIQLVIRQEAKQVRCRLAWKERSPQFLLGSLRDYWKDGIFGVSAYSVRLEWIHLLAQSSGAALSERWDGQEHVIELNGAWAVP